MAHILGVHLWNHSALKGAELGIERMDASGDARSSKEGSGGADPGPALGSVVAPSVCD